MFAENKAPMGTSESKDAHAHQQQLNGSTSSGAPPTGQQQALPPAHYREANGSVAGDTASQYTYQSATEGGSMYSIGTTGGWIAEIDQKIIESGLVPNGYSTAPTIPEGTSNRGCEPCVNPPKGPTGMKLFQAMRKEWRTKTINPPPPLTIDDVDPDDIADAIEDTPGDYLEPAVHLPVMLDILIDIWEDSGLYD